MDVTERARLLGLEPSSEDDVAKYKMMDSRGRWWKLSKVELEKARLEVCNCWLFASQQLI